MVKGYAEESEPAKSKRERAKDALSRLRSGAVQAGKSIREGAAKVQAARYKFYEETLPEFQKQIGVISEGMPSTSELLGFNELAPQPSQKTSTKKKGKRSAEVRSIPSVAVLILGEEEEEGE